MPRQLVVIYGAGASYDCASGTTFPEYRPPLVSGLFHAQDTYMQILNQYPLAEAAAPDIRRAVAAAPLETILREELKKSPHEYDRRRFRAIPLYLQHLLVECGKRYARHPDNYDRLNNEALRLDEVVYITLNYDTLLDRRLFAYEGGVQSMDSYITPGRRWSLIKLHGSVNWAHQIAQNVTVPDGDTLLVGTFAAMGEALDLDRQIVLRKTKEEIQLFRRSANNAYYPALSVPLGSPDELVCPPEHVDHLRQRLTAFNGLNILVVGYSGLDEEMLRLLAASGNTLRSLFVVNGSTAEADAASRRIAERLAPHENGRTPELFDGGFTKFAADRLHSYFAALPEQESH
jgi:hypothetical protein